MTKEDVICSCFAVAVVIIVVGGGMDTNNKHGYINSNKQPCMETSEEKHEKFTQTQGSSTESGYLVITANVEDAILAGRPVTSPKAPPYGSL